MHSADCRAKILRLPVSILVSTRAQALGNLFAGLVAGRLESLAPSALFSNVAIIVAIAGVVSIAVSPLVRKASAGAE